MFKINVVPITINGQMPEFYSRIYLLFIADISWITISDLIAPSLNHILL